MTLCSPLIEELAGPWQILSISARVRPRPEVEQSARAYDEKVIEIDQMDEEYHSVVKHETMRLTRRHNSLHVMNRAGITIITESAAHACQYESLFDE